MKTPAAELTTKKRDLHLQNLYWLMRIGMAVIWIWTAYVSWFVYPQAESLEWLSRIGLAQQAYLWFVVACLFDLGMGIASAIFSSRRLWQGQILAVILYTLVILIYLPEFFNHPFGPLTKNIAVLACLAYLTIMEPIKTA
jgi:branched-subunit amino acid ABC-type transport system permease component